MDLVITTEVPDAATHSFGQQPPRLRYFDSLTDVVRYDTRAEQRNQIDEQPERHWFLNWQWLDASAQQKLLEIALRAHGRYYPFLLEDWQDYACGLADWSYIAAGGETTTQLQKTYYKGETEEWTEDKKKIQPGSIYAPTIKLNGATKTEGVHFTLDDSTGLIDWTGGSSPNGALSENDIVTADYQFYFLVRFFEDRYIDQEHYIDWWRTQPLHLVEVIE